MSHRYLWGAGFDMLLADEQVSSVNSAGNTLWPLADHLGTIRDIADYDEGDPDFEITNHRVYDSFGRLESETNSAVDLSFGFTGKYTDADTGHTHHLNRWYDPTTGRWLSEDPIGFAGGDTNLSRYVGNNPTDSVDSLGLFEQGMGYDGPQSSTPFDGLDDDFRERIRGTETEKWLIARWELANGKIDISEFRELYRGKGLPAEGQELRPFVPIGNSWGIVGSYYAGLAQGTVNVANGFTDSLILIANLPSNFYNLAAWDQERKDRVPEGHYGRAPTIPYWDWSRDLVVHEPGVPGTWSDSHGWSRFSGGGGLDILLGSKGLKWLLGKGVPKSTPIAPNRTVIGKVKDLDNLAPGENTLLKHLPDQGSPRANWQQNSSVLRQEIRKGNPIRDASLNPDGTLKNYPGSFIEAERNLLRNQGWTFDPSTGLWSPAK